MPRERLPSRRYSTTVPAWWPPERPRLAVLILRGLQHGDQLPELAAGRRIEREEEPRSNEAERSRPDLTKLSGRQLQQLRSIMKVIAGAAAADVGVNGSA